MTGLGVLHASMIAEGVDIQQFRFQAGAAEFDCIFTVRDAPWLLTLTSRSQTPQFFAFPVASNYYVSTYLGDRYRDLRDLLYVDGRSGRKLEPSEFFGDLNRAIPPIAHKRAVPTTTEIAKLRHDLEERDKPYFDKWGQRGNGPSVKNKAKTLALLGPSALAFSLQVNKSSIWSATPTGREWIKPAERHSAMKQTAAAEPQAANNW